MTDDPPERPPAPLIDLLGAIESLVREIGRTEDAAEIYELALDVLQEVAGVTRSSILVLDNAGTARFVAWRGLSDAYREAVVGHFPWSLDEADPSPIVVHDVLRDPAFASLRPVLRRERIGAVVFVPLTYRERLVGKFVLYCDQPHRFSDEVVEFASTVGSLVALCIERARLYTALQESDRRKDAFLATLAHELRNPLAPAAAALAVAAQRPDDLVTVRGAHQVLDRSIGQMVGLVDELLDVSRITRDVVVLRKEPCDLSGVVHLATDTVRSLVGRQQPQLELSLAPLWVDADPLRLEQIVTNLLHNAVKFTPPEGHVWVSTRARDGGVELEVRDDGVGIEPSALPQLFELFAQADQSLARSGGGLGVGLTLVRKLVELHGGGIRGASTGPGQGSAFTVWLPGRIDQPEVSSPPPAPTAAGGRRVLVVDDNVDGAEMLATLLRTWGHEVRTVGDGVSALAAVTEDRPDVVLLDLGLPGMDGFDVACRLRDAGERMPIVVISGYSRPEDLARSRACGCDVHLAKPVDLDVLEAILADLAATSAEPGLGRNPAGRRRGGLEDAPTPHG